MNEIAGLMDARSRLGSRSSIPSRAEEMRARAGGGRPATSIENTSMGELSHFDETGASRMVDVSGKEITLRTARASGCVRMQPATLEMVRDRRLAKGDVLEVARLAGIAASKRTGDLIPLCHPLGLDAVELSLSPDAPDKIRVEARVKSVGRTGVEMEALVAVGVACLTIYDMCKAVDRAMVIGEIQLEEKTGGRRGPYRRSEPGPSPGP